MIKDYIKAQILSNFGHSPTIDQEKTITALADFVCDKDDSAVLVLRGFAGTGKTSLVGAFVKTMEAAQRPCVLMAPTGRAAKVFALYASHPAYTIHKQIYRQRSIEQNSSFNLDYNKQRNAIFIVDEASMISDNMHTATYGGAGSESFQSTTGGSLLDDLIAFVYGIHQTAAPQTACRLILVGDTAQLPPVGDTDSPALQCDTLRLHGLTPRTATLTQIVRQAETSGILWNATHLRQLIEQEEVYAFPRIRFAGFADVKNVPGNELIDTLGNCYARYGMDEVMVVCRSNKRALAYNNGIRNQILDREEELSSGDLVMIAKNNYHWLKPPTQTASSATPERTPTSFLANGDIAVVRRIRNTRELYGFWFADCQLRLPDYDDYELEATVLLDTLHAEAPALTHEQQDGLYNKVMEDYADIPQKRERLQQLRVDAHFNALQVKYAYAVTCHKAQGGQWSHIFIDQGYMTDDMLGIDYFRWLYTAITRATSTVYFVNWSPEQTLETIEK